MGLAVGDNQYLARTVIKQFVFSVLGYFGMTFFAHTFSFKVFRRTYWVIWLGTMVALLACLAFPAVGGAHAWIRIPLPFVEMTIQPSEFAKISTILIMAGYLGDIKIKYKNDLGLIARPVAMVFMFIFVVWFIQDDFGSAVVIGLIALACFMVPSHKQIQGVQNWLLVFVMAGIVGVVMLLSPLGTTLVQFLPLKDYQKGRILSAINPFADPYGDGYQLINGLVSFATGGFWGLGFGASVRKYTNFPAANTDFILSIVVEELGFFGFLLVFVPYCIIIYRCYKYAMTIRSEKHKMVLVGTAFYLIIHFVFNVGGVTGLIPLTGVPLLMISAGGSSTMSLMVCIGISQAVISSYNKGEVL